MTCFLLLYNNAQSLFARFQEGNFRGFSPRNAVSNVWKRSLYSSCCLFFTKGLFTVAILMFSCYFILWNTSIIIIVIIVSKWVSEWVNAGERAERVEEAFILFALKRHFFSFNSKARVKWKGRHRYQNVRVRTKSWEEEKWLDCLFAFSFFAFSFWVVYVFVVLAYGAAWNIYFPRHEIILFLLSFPTAVVRIIKA